MFFQTYLPDHSQELKVKKRKEKKNMILAIFTHK